MRGRCLLIFGFLSACTIGDLPTSDGGAVRSSDTRRSDEVGSPPLPDGASRAETTGIDSFVPIIDAGAPDLRTAIVDAREAAETVAPVIDGRVSLNDGAVSDLPVVADARPPTCSWRRNDRALSWTKLGDLPTTVNGFAKDATGAFLASGSGVGAYRSADRGVTWLPSATGLPSGSGVGVLFPCGTGLCTSLSQGIYTSTDNGAHWLKLTENPTSYALSNVVATPGDPQSLFGTSDNSILRSDDGGQGWFVVGGNLPVAPTVVAVSPQSANVVYAGTGGWGGNGQGVWKSTDGGRTFVAANRGMLDMTVSALAIASDGTVYAAGVANSTRATTLFRSDDGGANWTGLGLNLNQGYSQGTLARLVVNTQLNDALFVLRTSLAVEVSCDRGASWSTLVPAANTESSIFDSPSLLVDVDASGALVVLAGASGMSGTGAVTGGYRAVSAVDVPDAGAPAPDASVDAAAPVDAAPAFCSFWKSGRVVSWKSVDTLPSSVDDLVIGPNGSDLFASGSGAGVYKSTDLGVTWAAAKTGLSSSYTPSLAVCGKALCAAVDRAVYFSVDGTNWTVRASGVAGYSFSALYSVPGDATTLFGTGYSFMRSDDSGAGWIDVGGGLVRGVELLAFSPTDANVVYAGTSDGATAAQGVWKSTDRGESFVPANKGMLDMDIQALAVAADGTVFAGSPGKLMRSSNGGSDWQDITSRLAPIGSSAGLSRLAPGPGGSMFLLFGSGLTQVSCDGGQNWRSIVAATNVDVALKQPTLLPVGDAQHVILLSGFEATFGKGGGKRAVIE